VPGATDVAYHRGSVTSSPSRRYPVGTNTGTAPAYDVSTLRRKSLDHRREFAVVFVKNLYLMVNKMENSITVGCMSGESTKGHDKEVKDECMMSLTGLVLGLKAAWRKCFYHVADFLFGVV